MKNLCTSVKTDSSHLLCACNTRACTRTSDRPPAISVYQQACPITLQQTHAPPKPARDNCRASMRQI